MSTESVQPIKLVNVIDKRLECMLYGQKKQFYPVLKSAENVTWQQIQSNNYSTSSIVWNFNTNSERTIIDRRIYVKVQFRVRFTATPPVGAKVLQTGLDAPRAFPLASITQSLGASINGSSISVQYADFMQACLRTNWSHDTRNYDLSGTPHKLDNCQEYGDMTGATNNPMNDYFSSGWDEGRGAFFLDQIVSNQVGDGVTAKNAEVLFTVVEPLYLSPFLQTDELEAGFLGVKNMGVTFSFKAGNLSRVWSHNDSSHVLTNVEVLMGPSSNTTPPQLLINYLTPPLLDLGQQPRNIVYPYCRQDVYVNNMNTNLAAGASQEFTNNNIQMSHVPSHIWIYSNQPDAFIDHASPDCFNVIQSVSLQYLNTSGQFSSCTLNDLYNMSVKNGLKMSFTEFRGETQVLDTGLYHGTTGNVICISASDLALPSNVAPGMALNSQLSIKLSIKNPSGNAKQVQIVVILGYPGLMTVTEGTMITNTGLISQSDVVNMGEKSEYYSLISRFNGDGFLDTLKSIGKTIWSGIKQAAPVVKTGLDIASKLGFSEEEMKHEKGSAFVGGKKGKKGGCVDEVSFPSVGGKKMSSKELKKLLS